MLLFTLETGLAAGKSGLLWWRADRASRLLFGDKTQPGKTILCLCFFPAIIRFPQVGWLHPALHPVVRSSCTLNSSTLHFYFALHVINLVITHTESSVVYYYAVSLLKPRNKEVVFVYNHRLSVYLVVCDLYQLLRVITTTCSSNPVSTPIITVLMYCTVLYCNVLYFIVFYCIALYCVILYFSILPLCVSTICNSPLMSDLTVMTPSNSHRHNNQVQLYIWQFDEWTKEIKHRTFHFPTGTDSCLMSCEHILSKNFKPHN